MYQADFRVQAAVLSGLVHTGQALGQQLPLNCPSSNCTWPIVASLSVCSKCNDVTSEVRQTSTDEYALIMDLGAGGDPVAYGNSTRLALPNGLWISDFDGSTGNPQTRMVALGTGDRQGTVSMQAVDTLIWSMTMLNADADPRNTSRAWPDTPIRALECALYYCVKSYNTTMTNNTVLQPAEDTPAERSAGSWQPTNIGYDRGINRTRIESLNELQGSAIEHTDLMLGDGYNITQVAIMSTSALFQSTFAMDFSNSKNNMTGFYLNGDGSHKPSIMQPLFQGREDLPGLFANIAISMSNAIRTMEGQTVQHSGEAGRQITVYRVQWEWIALPAAVVLASLTQLILTMLSSGSQPLWKSNTLAVLSRGPCVIEVFDGASSIVELTDAAKKQDINLFPREKKPKG